MRWSRAYPKSRSSCSPTNRRTARTKFSVTAERLGLCILTMQDADYPARLRGIFEPPCLLYVKGTLPAFDEEVAVAMVGTRACTPYGTQSAEKIAYGLAKQGALVVSGAARGIDSAASPRRSPRGRRDRRRARQRPGRGVSRGERGRFTATLPPRARCCPNTRRERRRRAGIFPSATASSAACVLRPWWSKRRSSVRARSSPPIRRSSRDATCWRSAGPIDASASRGCNRLIADGAGLVSESWDILREYQAMYPHKILGERVVSCRTRSAIRRGRSRRRQRRRRRPRKRKRCRRST